MRGPPVLPAPRRQGTGALLARPVPRRRALARAAHAAAALTDTLAAVAATPAAATVVLEGEPGPWLPEGIVVIRQRGRGLDERLQASFEDAGTPALVIGSDTPQVTPKLLGQALA